MQISGLTGGLADYPTNGVSNSIPLDDASMAETNDAFATPGENLAAQMQERVLTRLGRFAARHYKLDKNSRGQWERDRARYLKAFMMHHKAEDFPWEGSASAQVPFLPESVGQFAARAFEALAPSKGLVSCLWGSAEKKPKAQRVERHLEHQLRWQTGFQAALDVALVQLALDGSAFIVGSWDPETNAPRVDAIPATDVVVSLRYRGPIENARRISHVIRLTKQQIASFGEDGYFVNTDRVSDDVNPLDETGPLEQVAKEAEGVESPTTHDDDSLRQVIQMHCYYDIDDSGEAEAVIVTFDLDTQTVLRVESREYTDAKGKDKVLCHFIHLEFLPNPSTGVYGIGLGQMLHSLIETANASLRQMLNAGTLATSNSGLVADRSPFAKGDFSLRPGEFKPVETNSEKLGDDIYRFEFQGPIPVQLEMLKLMDAYARRMSSVTDIMQGLAPRGSNTTATEVLTLEKASLTPFNSIYRRVRLALQGLYGLIAKLNHLHLDDETYCSILGEDSPEFRMWQEAVTKYEQATMMQAQLEAQAQAGGMMPPPQALMQLAQVLANPPPPLPFSVAEDYGAVEAHQIVPTADPEITSRAERVALARDTWQLVATSPLTAQNPHAVWEAGRRVLEGLGVERWEEMWPEPAPPQPPPDKNQILENEDLLKGQPMFVLENQPHQQHLQIITEFKQTQFYQMLPPEGRDALDKHEREHASYLYGQMMQQGVANAPGAIPPPGSGGPLAPPLQGRGGSVALPGAHSLSHGMAGEGDSFDLAPPSLRSWIANRSGQGPPGSPGAGA